VNALAHTYVMRGVAGLKPGRRFHLGNYFGTLQKVIQGQERYPNQNFLFVADLHGMIDPAGKGTLRSHIYRLVKNCLYLGVDPARTCIYLQSEIPELMHFMWRLACISPNLPAQGAKGQRPPQDFYKTLMAADILGLRASAVNVGGDLEEQMRYCERLARFMNKEAEASVLPFPYRTVGSGIADNVPGSDGQRMSYSARNYIPVFEETPGESDDAVDNIVAAVADNPSRSKSKKTVDIPTQLLTLFSARTGELKVGVRTRLDNAHKFVLLKASIRETFLQAREAHKADRLRNSDVEDILEAGRVRARAEYRETIKELGL
jgi:tryptophanyl-tRNA synthetase